MTPRAEAMVVWRCPDCGRRGLDYGGRRTLTCFWNGEDSQHAGAEVERIEVVPAADYEHECNARLDLIADHKRALDALEQVTPALAAFAAIKRVQESAELRAEAMEACSQARAVLRAAGRLDG